MLVGNSETAVLPLLHPGQGRMTLVHVPESLEAQVDLGLDRLSFWADSDCSAEPAPWDPSMAKV